MDPSSRRNWSLLLGALIIAIAGFVAVFSTSRAARPGSAPAFETAWQQQVTECTQRFHNEVARIGADRDLPDEARSQALIAAQDRYAAEMAVINASRSVAVESFQLRSMLLPFIILVLCASVAGVLLWRVLKKHSLHEQLT